jgi:steroid delta-isomerase-like uncharacterized protein
MTPTTPTQNLSTAEVIDGIFADAATGDLENVLRWWADDGILEDVTLARAFEGKQAIREYLAMYFSAFRDLKYESVRTIISGPSAVVEWMQTTRVFDTLDGVKGVGQELTLHAVDVFHISDGLVQHEVSWYGDGWFRQRLEGAAHVPPVLPMTPPLAPSGSRF